MPDDGRQVIESERAAVLLDRSVQRHYGMPAVILSAGKADIADDTNEAASRNQRAEAMRPYLVKLGQELLVVNDVAHLARGIAVLFQGPVRRRCKHQVHALRLEPVHAASIAEVEHMAGRDSSHRFFDQLDQPVIFGDARDVGLRIFERVNFGGNKPGESPRELLSLSSMRFFLAER